MPILTRLIGRVKPRNKKGLQFALNECVQFALNECVQFAGRHARRAEELSERELTVTKLVARGLSNSEIAAS